MLTLQCGLETVAVSTDDQSVVDFESDDTRHMEAILEAPTNLWIMNYDQQHESAVDVTSPDRDRLGISPTFCLLPNPNLTLLPSTMEQHYHSMTI